MGGRMKEKYGYHGINVSGNTTNCAPFAAASAIAARTRSSVPVDVSRSGAIWTAATLTFCFSAICFSPSAQQGDVVPSERPGVEHEGVLVAVKQCQIQYVERTDRNDAGNQGWLAVSVERLQRKTAGIDLAAFCHELDQRVVEILMTGKCLVPNFREATLHAERHARTVQENRSLEAFAHQPRGLQHIDETDRAFERDRMKCHQCLFARFGFDVLENLLFVIDQKVTLLARRHCYSWHVVLLAIVPGVGRACREDIATGVPIEFLLSRSS